MKLKEIKLTAEQKTKLIAGIQLAFMAGYCIYSIHNSISANRAEKDRERKMLQKQKEKLQKLAFHGQIAYLKQENKNRLRQLKQERI